MSSSVLVREAVLITPSGQTPTCVLPLSAVDSQLFLRFTVEYLLIYSRRPGSDRSATAARLKSALAQALVPYYPLAGRVRSRSDGAGLEVVCRAQGAGFIESVSGYTVSDFGSAPIEVSERREFLSLHLDDVLKGGPPLVIQLTWLADGGVAVGIGFNHCLIDGIGSGEFLNSLAELATGKHGPDEIKPKPVWSRYLMNPTRIDPDPHCNPLTHPEFNRVPDLCNFESRFSPENLTPTSALFDRRRINELKRLCNSESQLSESYTSFEVVSAHIWRSWARALNLPPNQILKLLFSVNIRARIDPNLPGGFYGNAFVLGCAQTTVIDLAQKGLGWAARLIRGAKDRVNNEYVRQVVETVSSGRAFPDSVGVLILSQWSRLGLERVDFGMGRPVQVGPIQCDRYCLMLPVSDQKDVVKVMVAVPIDAVDQYLYFLQNIYA